MQYDVGRGAAAAERVGTAANDPSVIEMEPEQLAATGALVANGGDLADKHTKHNTRGVTVFAVGFDVGQMTGLPKALNTFGHNQLDAIRIGEYHPLECRTFGPFGKMTCRRTGQR